MDEPAQAPWWRTPSGIVFCGFLAVAGFFLLTEHTAHVFGALPYLLLAACPLMHVFMHHGHRHHGDDGGHRDDKDSTGGSR
jgi:Protein of unknown function (DUF2933)